MCWERVLCVTVGGVGGAVVGVVAGVGTGVVAGGGCEELERVARVVFVAAADDVVAEEAVFALVDLSNVATVEDSDVLW